MHLATVGVPKLRTFKEVTGKHEEEKQKKKKEKKKAYSAEYLEFLGRGDQK